MEKQGRSYSLEQKLWAIKLVTEDGQNRYDVARRLNIGWTTLNHWLSVESDQGPEALTISHEWKRYSQTTKQSAVKDYLTGQFSQADLVRKYQVSSLSVLKRWIDQYTNGIDIKATSKGRSRMKQGRTTTYQERIEIVQYTLAHDKDYQQTAAQFKVSYQQVYTWVRKYEANGVTALQDHRGQHLNKSIESLTETEQLKLRVKELEARNDYLETREELAKKLMEIRRRPR